MPSLDQPVGEMPPTDHEGTTGEGLPQAPFYKIPLRRFGAVEHPMIIKDVDKGIKTFGRGHSFQTVSISSLQ